MIYCMTVYTWWEAAAEATSQEIPFSWLDIEHYSTYELKIPPAKTFYHDFTQLPIEQQKKLRG